MNIGIRNWLTIGIKDSNKKGSISRRSFKVFRSNVSIYKNRVKRSTGYTVNLNLDETIVSWRSIIGTSTKRPIEWIINVSDRSCSNKRHTAPNKSLDMIHNTVWNTSGNSNFGIWHVSDYFETFIGQIHCNNVCAGSRNDSKHTTKCIVTTDRNNRKENGPNKDLDKSEPSLCLGMMSMT